MEGTTKEADGLGELDRKITEAFPACTVRKDLVGAVKGNAVVPTYVLEYLLSKYATTTDRRTIDAGIERVRGILRDNYVHRNRAEAIKSMIREKGHHQVIDKVQVTLNEKEDRYEATFANLSISKVVVDTGTVVKNQRLLLSGVWCMCRLGYEPADGIHHVPWILEDLRPVQLARIDLDDYRGARRGFSDGEWTDLLMQSIGFDPSLFGERAKMLHLVRMVPFVERNYNLMELGPKGTGKSHIYSEFSPHGMLISGGEVTKARLFINERTGNVGLVGYWDTVAFDEFAGRMKRPDKTLVDIMKNYMANKSFSRGSVTQSAEASMAFVGNTSHNVPYMLKNSDLFEELPEAYHDPAFLDRIHAYVPGWEFEQIRSEMFTTGYGFVVDYLAEMLHALRDEDYSTRYERYFTLSDDLSTRDRDGVRKTFSGLMKLLYPDGEATAGQMEPLLRCAIECRKRVKDQLCRIDPTMAPVGFSYTRVGSGEKVEVPTLEELDYPELYHLPRPGQDDEAKAGKPGDTASEGAPSPTPTPAATAAGPHPALTDLDLAASQAKEDRVVIEAGRRGVTYADLFGPWIAKAHEIVLQDPFIRMPHQLRNLAEFMETVYAFTERSEEVRVRLVTVRAENDALHPDIAERQENDLRRIADAYRGLGIAFTYGFRGKEIHDRCITTDTGWIIDIGVGLDIYERFDTNWLSPALRLQQLRTISHEVTFHYNRVDTGSGDSKD